MKPLDTRDRLKCCLAGPDQAQRPEEALSRGVRSHAAKQRSIASLTSRNVLRPPLNPHPNPVQVFLAQIHRRAALLNDPFQDWVASVILAHSTAAQAAGDDDHELAGFEDMLDEPLADDAAAEPAQLEAAAPDTPIRRSEVVVFRNSLAGSDSTHGPPTDPAASAAATASLVLQRGGGVSESPISPDRDPRLSGIGRMFSRMRSSVSGGLTVMRRRSTGGRSDRQSSFVASSELMATASTHATRAVVAARCNFGDGAFAPVEVHAAPIKTLERMREKVPPRPPPACPRARLA